MPHTTLLRASSSRAQAVVRLVAIAGIALLGTGFEYPSTPADNLVVNPWFHVDCESSLEGWSVDQTSGGMSWGGSEKTQNPTDENCNGDFTGHAARWADQQGDEPFAPDEDARLWQVVGPVDPSETTLRFHFLMVFHRMNRFRAEISGAEDPDGPWTPVWTPIDRGWLTAGGPNAPFDGTCPGGMQDRDCLWDKVTEAELGTLEPLTMELEQGYPYYRIEFLGNYPEPDGTATGDVGGKIARVYFAVGEAAGGEGGLDSTGDEGEGSGTGEGSASSGSQADTGGLAGSGDSTSAAANGSDDDSGCACGLGSGHAPGPGWGWALVLVPWCLRRRRPERRPM